MLRFEEVTKRYGETVAVDGLTLELEVGEIFGLLGPNGAGKTTAMKLAVGLLAPDAGQVYLGAHGSPSDPVVRRRLGFAPQSLAIYEDLTGAENLRFFGRILGLRRSRLSARVTWALKFVNLHDRRDQLVKTWSGGMKRRLNLAAGVIHEPDLLLLDEPTVGVDPQSRNAIFDNVLALKKAGHSLVYTTHYMEEAERLCDRVAIMDAGTVLALDTVPNLIAAHGGSSVLVVETGEGEQRHETDDPLKSLNSMAGADVRSFRVESPSLETVFLNLTGHALRD